ncbi:hypothetical protein E8E13_009537 [Curvularia kusanoi]|uniref:Uncharacterized protein n=1 Tax=Curvularia kusanoi TaxID=90978 RepID=A0A9P4WCH5_CURKU|nr:hypothetical protein E8E13_009537 [Curvularia kusanoi]
MIRTGRSSGWLKQPIDALPTWAAFHGVSFNGIKVGPLPGFEERGSTVIADRELEGGKVEPLLAVPKELIISRQNIELLAKSDRHLREVLEAAGDFGRTTRGAVLIFLLMQATICCPDIKDIGVLNPLTEYVKYLPDELLPTFWSEEEQELLTGTTLQPAVRAKLNSLLREFELVRTATEGIEWCANYWWDEDSGLVTFDDWLCVDAMYRSRALEFPGVGDWKKIGKDGEISITYGDDKGACENIFSYGFLESPMESAKVMFLDVEIPDDDPLRPAKMFVNTAAPGFRLFDKAGEIDWESDFIWLVIVNEEDGLDFKIRQTIDGKREIQALWRDAELDDTSKLHEHLTGDPMWDVYQLRAAVLLQNRVDAQINTLKEYGTPQKDASIRNAPWRLAERLRTLELAMLERAFEAFESQKASLLESTVVQQYLGLGGDDDGNEEVDFT